MSKRIYPRTEKLGWFGPKISISEFEYVTLKRIPILRGVDYALTREFEITLPWLVPDVSELIPGVLFCQGRMVIQSGSRWNGASGPTIDTANVIMPSLVHDMLYAILEKYGEMYFTREEADRFFYLLLRAEGMWWLRARSWYRAVRRFGGRNNGFLVG